MTDQLDPKKLKKNINSQWWRLNHLYWIVDKSGNKIRFKPNKVQKTLFANLHNRNQVLKARQHGVSTFVSILILDMMLWSENRSAGIVDKSLEDAKKKLQKIKFAYDHLDDPDDSHIAPLGALIKQKVQLANPTNSEAITFSNGCAAWCGTSLRGGTVQILHLSELGAISYYFPKKAQEIKTGALNTVSADQLIIAESTHYGAKSGLNYEICKLAMDAQGKELSTLDWRFHFFPWQDDPEYAVSNLTNRITPAANGYFNKLEKEQGLTFTPEQKTWWSLKAAEQKEAMGSEYPTTPGEAFHALIKGSIYGKIISDLRGMGRITPLALETAPVFVAWDLGISDSTVMIAFQCVGREIHVLDAYQNQGQPASHYAGVSREWDRKWNVIDSHFLPHDANTRDKGSGKTYVDAMTEAGVSNVRVVNRTPDIWLGINALREMLPRFWFNAEPLEASWEWEGDERASALACLETYRTQTETASGVVRENPVHDASSHVADAFRLIGEAAMRGMFKGGIEASHGKHKIEVKTGMRSHSRSRKVVVKR